MPLPVRTLANTPTEHLSDHNALHAQYGTSVRGSLGYAERTTDQTGITAETDLTSLTVTATVLSGERIRISAEMFIASTVNNDVASLKIKEGATVLSQGAFVVPTGGFRCHVSAIITPTAAAHTYKLSLARSVGTGNISMNAGAGYPGYILVEGIGT